MIVKSNLFSSKYTSVSKDVYLSLLAPLVMFLIALLISFVAAYSALLAEKELNYGVEFSS